MEMATNDDTKAMEEIYNGLTNLRKRLEKDVRQMCELVHTLRAEFYKALEENPPLKVYKGSFDKCCLAIYRSLKLHLAFHFGDDIALAHEKLGILGRSLDLNGLDEVPNEEHTVDPGSKVLEIVSRQFLSIKGAVTLGNLYSNLSRNFVATKVRT